jgi:hypothetical protein
MRTVRAKVGHPRRMRMLAVCAGVWWLIPVSAVHGAIEVIETSATYHMGDNDSKLVGHRLALMEAKRKALEKAGTYVQSISEVKDFQLTRDEVRTYSAGILSAEETRDPKYEMVGKNMEVTVYVKVSVDKDDVARQIAALRKDKEATQELKAARKKQIENEQKVAKLNKQLRTAKKGAQSTQKAQAAREEALTGAEQSSLAAHAAVAERYGKSGYRAAETYFKHNVMPAAGACYRELKPKSASARDDGVLLVAAPALVLALCRGRYRKTRRENR